MIVDKICEDEIIEGEMKTKMMEGERFSERRGGIGVNLFISQCGTSGEFNGLGRQHVPLNIIHIYIESQQNNAAGAIGMSRKKEKYS